MPAQENTSNQEQEVTTFQCEFCANEYERSNNHMQNEDGEDLCYDCYYENYHSCESCGDEIHSDYVMYSDHMDAYYCEGCYPGDGEDVDLDNYCGTNIPASHSAEGDTFSINKFERL